MLSTPRPQAAPSLLFDDGLTRFSKSKPAESTTLGEPPKKSNRQLKAEAKKRAWEERIAKREAERTRKAEAGDNEEAAFLEKKRKLAEQRKLMGSGSPEKNEKQEQQHKKQKKRKEVPEEHQRKRQKTAGELPLLNGFFPTSVQSPKQKPKNVTQETPQKLEPKFTPSQSDPIHPKQRSSALLSQRQSLPIWAHQSALRQCLIDRDVLVMVGATGSGKSTQLPQFMLNEPWMARRTVPGIDGKVGGCIAITQPRRVAATNLARRVATEAGVKLGEEVGYSVRFDAKAGPKTKIKFLTDGMLLQEMLRDPLLRKYSCIVVDEAHERTVDTDLVMGFLRRLVYGERKGSLKVVVMSATMEVEGMSKFMEENNGQDLDVAAEGEDAAEEGGDIEMKEALAAAVEEALAKEDEEAKEKEEETHPESRKEKRRKKKKKKQSQIDMLLAPRSATPEPVSPVVAEETKPQDDGPESMALYGSIALFQVPGRQFPVDVYHAPEPVTDYVDSALRTIFQIHYSEPLPGDILVFLTGQEEIDSLQKLIEEYAKDLDKTVPRILVLPLYAALPPKEQQRVFLPAPTPNTRKIILSTNIAETSVTVSGVRHVIDTGKAKIKQFRPNLGLDSLLVSEISQSSALQRTGRAGREAPGKCYRLYTEESFKALAQATVPEILRADLAQTILRLKARGCDDIVSFPFLSPPPRNALLAALEQLLGLAALDDTGALTQLGKDMSLLPLLPPQARVLLAAKNAEVVEETIDVISALSGTDSIFVFTTDEEQREAAMEKQKEFLRQEGDHIMLLEIVRAYAAVRPGERRQWCKDHFINPRTMANIWDVRKQLRVLMDVSSSAPEDDEEEEGSESVEVVSPDTAQAVLKCFLTGYYRNTAKLDGRTGGYVTVVGAGNDVVIHPGSSLTGKKREAVVFQELVWTTRPYARWCSAVQMDWIADAAPGVLKRSL
ncbi:P-loop containing nucleoside triphosphate hydrolase protein [Ascodesmis nigricans]|uniref:RNA helicase n=1 Tax=Ascodesmis nigricans TaxID=341454 RepID=A0A4S2N8D2_9PEZI|nr:P-loop containing nucleoside triphosphate hydrolase protein [Ascodesmis nigricans]